MEKNIAAAQLLYKYNKFSDMPRQLNDGTIKMTNSYFISSNDHRSRPVQMELKAPFKFEDADFTQREVIEICTMHEYDEAMKTAGFAAKVIDLFKPGKAA